MSEESPEYPGRFDFDTFATLYDDATIDAIEHHSGEPDNVGARSQSGDQRSTEGASTRRTAGSSNFAAVGMMTAGLLRGIDAALDPEDKEPIVDFFDEDQSGPQQPVTVFLVPGNPKASVAIVRPWLFSPRPGLAHERFL